MTVAAAAEKTAVVELTELEKIEPTRVDGVGTPANGFPILMMKSIELVSPAGPEVTEKAPTRPAGVLGKAKRKAALAVVEKVASGELAPVQLAKDAAGYDESADIAGALDVIAKIGSLICSEATALGSGRMEEAFDICCLMQAVDAMQTFLCREQSQDDGSGAAASGGDLGLNGEVTYLAQSAAEDTEAKSEAAYDELVKEKYSADQKKKMLAQGKAIPNAKGDPSYPIDDREDVDNAVHAVGRGNVPHGKIKAHIKRNAKRVGATDLLPDSWKSGKKTSKGAILTVSEPHESATPITPDVIKQAVAEAVAASEERLKKEFDAELAKVKAMPIPGGPQLVTSQNRAPAMDPRLAKAARYRAIAAQTSDPDTKRSYLDLAAREEGAPITKG